MSFIAYVIAWVIIMTLTVVISTFIGKVSRFVVNHTPLREFINRKDEEHYRRIARFMIEEFENKKQNIENNDCEVNKNDADI